MDLDTYLKQPGSLKTAELARRIGVPHVAQLNQWRNPNTRRRPSAKYAAAIVRETNGAVEHWHLRPDDWHEIWEFLIGTEGAPPVPAVQGA